jgi:hypothetical protein
VRAAPAASTAMISAKGVLATIYLNVRLGAGPLGGELKPSRVACLRTPATGLFCTRSRDQLMTRRWNGARRGSRGATSAVSSAPIPNASLSAPPVQRARPRAANSSPSS